MRTSHIVILAGSIVLAGIVVGIAQQRSPDSITGCIVGAPASIATGQSIVLSCNGLGQLRVTTTP